MSANIDRIRLEAIEKRRGEAEELVKSRKRKLAELYTLSSLSRIRTTTDEASLKHVKDSVLSFLEKNDVQRGHEFDPATLPPLEYDIEEQAAPQQTPQQTRPVPTAAPPVPKPVQTPAEPSQPAQVSKSEAPKQSSPVTAKTTSMPPVLPSSKTPQPQQPQQTQTQQAPPPPSQPVQSQPPAAPTTDKSKPSEPQQKPTHHHVQAQIIEIPKPPPKKRKVEDRLQLFDPENKDAVDTLVLLLKNNLPPKVAESTPLAKLYYLAQTLPLVKLMPTTHKAVTSTMYETALTEGKINVVHSRIEELKRQGKWSLRQPTRFLDPYRMTQRTHWDNLLSEMNWMAVDFKEEKKLRVATCALLAESIEDYWTYGKVCCVKTRPIKHLEQPVSETGEVVMDVDEPQTEQQEPTEEKDSIDVSKLLERPDPSKEIVPPELPEFTRDEFERLKYEDENVSPFKLFIDTNEINPKDKSLLDGVPTFSSFQRFDKNYDQAPLVPVSKALVHIEDDTWYNVYLKQIEEETVVPEPQKGLFGFSSQRRITSSIKPPPPPNLKYLNLRTPTIWLPEDDQNLIEYVNQFSFNWGVVSAHLAKRPTRSYQSNIERRTPWQCFERYIQLNDTFQIHDMRGPNYMGAMKWLEHAHHIQATTKRRISPLGVGPESIQRGHKRLRWASLFEAVRKCMRKREAVTRPNPNMVRKVEMDKKIPTPTPAELSRLKYERDKAIQEAHLKNLNEARNGGRPVTATAAAAAARANSQGARPLPQGAAPGTAGGVPATSPPAGAVPAIPQQAHIEPVKRPSSVPAPPIAKTAVVPQGVAAGVLKGPNGVPYTPEQLQQLMQLKQRKLAQQQQAAAAAAAGSMQGSPSPNAGNAQLVAQMRSNSNPVPGQGAGSPVPMVAQSNGGVKGYGTVSAGSAGSNGGQRKPTFVPAHVSNVIQQIQASNPSLSKQEVTKMAAQYLANISKQNRSNSNGTVSAGSQVKSSSGAATPRPQQSPVVQARPAPVAVPTPQQILQQQQAALAAAASSPGQAVNGTPTTSPSQQMRQAPQTGSPVNVPPNPQMRR